MRVGLLYELGLDSVLDPLKELRRFSAHRLFVHLAGRQAELGGGGDQDLIGVHQFFKGIGSLAYRNP